MSAAVTQPYAVCSTCERTFADRDEVRAHMSASMEPTSPEEQARGVMARGHSVRVVNPTDEEREEQRVSFAVSNIIERAVERAMVDLDNEVERGRLTIDQVKSELTWYSDFADAWDEWNDGSTR